LRDVLRSRPEKGAADDHLAGGKVAAAATKGIPAVIASTTDAVTAAAKSADETEDLGWLRRRVMVVARIDERLERGCACGGGVVGVDGRPLDNPEGLCVAVPVVGVGMGRLPVARARLSKSSPVPPPLICRSISSGAATPTHSSR